MKKKTKQRQQTKVGYVDGYVLVIPKKRVAEYRKMAKEAAQFWLKHGALSVRECMGDDLNPDMGKYKQLPFQKLTKLKRNETVWFSYIEYRSKAERNRINKKVMAEMEEYHKEHPDHMEDMPFDMRRFSYGGFSAEVSC